MIHKYRIGSFNMKNLSRSTNRDFETIRKIIKKEKLDIVAFQEILSEGKALEQIVEKNLYGWEFCWAQAFRTTRDLSENPRTSDPRGEGFAYAWNPKRLSLATSSTAKGARTYEPRSIRQAMRYNSTAFDRTPYYARFIPVHGGFFEFRFINVHLHFGDNSSTEIEKRKEEYSYLLEKVYPSLSLERRYGNNRTAYTFVMGDYNLNLNIPRGEYSSKINASTYIDAERLVGEQKIITVQDQLTTLKNKETENLVGDDNPNRGYSQNYDHFTFDILALQQAEIGYKTKRIDAVRKYYNDDFEGYRMKVSDHIPIILELTMNERNE